MQYIQRDKLVHIEWSIFRGTSQVPEDFSRALVKMFLIGGNEKYLLTATAEGGKLLADLPGDLPEGAYSLEAIWVKNYGNLLPHRQPLTPGGEPVCPRRPGPHPNDPCFIHPHDNRFNDRCLMRSRKDYVFALTDYPSEETVTGESGEVTVRLASSVATYGYDGLSAYQIAVMRGDFSGTEGEFLAQSGFTKLKTINGESLIGEGNIEITDGGTLETATETKLGGIRAATKTQDETVEVKIDPDTGKLYVPESESTALEAATETQLGGIKAAAKTANETVEAKIGPDGKLYVPASQGEELKTATETTLGGIRAATKTSLETQEVKIDPSTGKLYTQPGGEGGVEIVNNPDEEDLHSIEKSTDVHVLQFADKEYNASAFSGLGRVYLRKNISSNKNILTQAMISKANTRYIIQYDYDLDGETITVPEGCTLDFQGGSLGNGTIKGSNTRVKADIEKIFNANLSVVGTWNIPHSYAEWFGADNTGVQDSSSSLNKAIKMVNSLRLLKGTYLANSPIIVSMRDKLEGDMENTTLKAGTTMNKVISAVGHDDTDSLSYGYIRNLRIDGDNKATRGLEGIGVTNGFVIENLYVTSCTEAGVFISRSWYAVYRNIWVWYCKYGFYITNSDANGDGNKGDINGIQFANLWLNHNTEHALYIKGIPGYGNQFNSCTFENSGGDAEVYLESIAGSINFINCYTEGTNANGIKATSAYANVGIVNVVGGIYCNTYKEQFNIGNIGSFNLFGVHLLQFSNPSTHNIVSSASSNYLDFNFQGGEASTGDSVSCTGRVLGSYGKAYNSNTNGCNANSFAANKLSVLGYKGVGTALDDTYFEIGSSKREAVSDNYMYRMRVGFSYNDGITINALVRDSSGTDKVSNIGHLSRYQIKYSKFVATDQIDFPVVSSLGIGDYGGCKWDTNTHKPYFYFSDKWFDARGVAYDVPISGTTSERPSAFDIRPGYMYKDTTLDKWIIWTGNHWEDLEGNEA